MERLDDLSATGQPLALPRRKLAAYRLRARLWTGPISHLCCGLLDLLEAARRYRRGGR
jgi:hypothetical protein